MKRIKKHWKITKEKKYQGNNGKKEEEIEKGKEEKEKEKKEEEKEEEEEEIGEEEIVLNRETIQQFYKRNERNAKYNANPDYQATTRPKYNSNYNLRLTPQRKKKSKD